MREIPLSQGKVALVDDADYEWLVTKTWFARRDRNTWYAGSWGPRATGRRSITMHRLILGLVSKYPEVDHRDGNGLNNQRHNLRIATRFQQLANARLWKNNTSGFRGVWWCPNAKKWRARITVNRHYFYLGAFHDKQDAIRAYSNAAVLHFGEFCPVDIAAQTGA